MQSITKMKVFRHKKGIKAKKTFENLVKVSNYKMI